VSDFDCQISQRSKSVACDAREDFNRPLRGGRRGHTGRPLVGECVSPLPVPTRPEPDERYVAIGIVRGGAVLAIGFVAKQSRASWRQTPRSDRPTSSHPGQQRAIASSPTRSSATWGRAGRMRSSAEACFRVLCRCAHRSALSTARSRRQVLTLGPGNTPATGERGFRVVGSAAAKLGRLDELDGVAIRVLEPR
jgi:hypothetical protein